MQQNHSLEERALGIGRLMVNTGSVKGNTA